MDDASLTVSSKQCPPSPPPPKFLSSMFNDWHQAVFSITGKPFETSPQVIKHCRERGNLNTISGRSQKESFPLHENKLEIHQHGLLSCPLTSAQLSSYLFSLIAHSFILFPSKQHCTKLIYTMASSGERSSDRHSPAIKSSCSPRWVSISSTTDRE